MSYIVAEKRIWRELVQVRIRGDCFISIITHNTLLLLSGSLYRQSSSVYFQQKAGAEREQELSATLLGTS